MRKSRLWLLLVVLVAGVAAVGVARRPLTVTAVAEETEVALRLYGLGSVEARVLSRVGFQVGARLAGLSADAGDLVARGQDLATLDAAEQEARVARARAAVAANGAAVARAEAAVSRA